MTNNNIVLFNPLDKRNLAVSVGQAILRQPVIPLGNLETFGGAGIYAIYYNGSFNVYEPIASRNQNNLFSAPIYVGKAVPKGSRKGGNLVAAPGKVLYDRLSEHSESIDKASNIDIADFHCRYLIMDDVWIPLGESLLIAKFYPLWNKLIDGFGNHDPGGGRHAGKISRWDVLHPGRPWGKRCKPRMETAKQIACEVRDYLRNNPPPEDNTIVTI
ncbi:MAG: Eco29kI family restriction endonuclease [Smithellaceae bacterium]